MEDSIFKVRFRYRPSMTSLIKRKIIVTVKKQREEKHMSESTEKITRAALVTGAGRGIGRAIAVELARHGYHILVDYAGNASAAEETVALCQAEGVDAFAVQADVSDEEAVKGLVKSALERFGRIDVLINNAGITRDNLMLRMSAEDFDLVIEKNLRGAFLMTKYVGKEMLHQRAGRIVNISSVVGVHGNAGQANYAASKAGLIGLTKTTALEYASRGITANAIAPGFIDTDMTKVLPEKVKEAMLQQIPLRQFGSPEDVAKAAAFLASDDARYITGQVLGVDGGMGC